MAITSNLVYLVDDACSTFHKYRDFSDSNLMELKYRLSRENWSDTLNCNSTNGKYESFISTFKFNLEIACPLKNKKAKIKNQTPWMSDEIKIAKRNLLDCYGRWKVSKDQLIKNRYNRLKSEYRRLIRNTEASFYFNKISESRNPSKTTWQIINTARPSKQKEESKLQLMVDNTLTHDPLLISNGLNKYFSNIT